jgi:hypothetical protein
MRHNVKDVEEAVALADSFKAEGKYDWFRGQTHTWPPYSSLFRIQHSGATEAESEAYERHHQFIGWLKTVPELAPFADLSIPENIHAIMAIMQHYGVPTHYIDFTTDPAVAAFFAGDTKNPKPDATACIYCLDTKELLNVWNVMKDLDERRGAELELVTIDLSHLWRLQAQEGRFVYCNYNWDIDFPMDVICFPFSGCPSYPTRDAIYPIHKSPLELVLDRYFEWERGRTAQADFRKMFEDLAKKNPNVRWFEQPDVPGNYHASAIRGGNLSVLDSWSELRLKSWRNLPNHNWAETGTSAISLNLDFDAAPAVLGQAVRYGVSRVLKLPDIRAKRVDWSIVAKDVAMARILESRLRDIWNGMRWLPYTDQQIAEACAGTATLLRFNYPEITENDREKVFGEFCGSGFVVEFGTAEGNASRGFASRASLGKALRLDLKDILAEELLEESKDVRRVLLWIYSPMRLFEFEPFVDLFAREIIPTQILSRSYVIYSPFDLVTFGLP